MWSRSMSRTWRSCRSNEPPCVLDARRHDHLRARRPPPTRGRRWIAARAARRMSMWVSAGGTFPHPALRASLLPEGEGRTAACTDTPVRASAGVMERNVSPEGRTRALPSEIWVCGAWQDHAPGWRNARAARDLPDDVRIRQAVAVALPLRPGRGQQDKALYASGTNPGVNAPTIRHRPVSPSIRLLRANAKPVCEGKSGGWLGRPRRTGCQRSTPASASSRFPPHVTTRPGSLPPARTRTSRVHPAAGARGLWHGWFGWGKNWGDFRVRDWNCWGWGWILSTLLARFDPSFRPPRACPTQAKRRVRGSTGLSRFPWDRLYWGGRL